MASTNGYRLKGYKDVAVLKMAVRPKAIHWVRSQGYKATAEQIVSWKVMSTLAGEKGAGKRAALTKGTRKVHRGRWLNSNQRETLILERTRGPLGSFRATPSKPFNYLPSLLVPNHMAGGLAGQNVASHTLHLHWSVATTVCLLGTHHISNILRNLICPFLNRFQLFPGGFDDACAAG